jgi:hypothetical protein
VSEARLVSSSLNTARRWSSRALEDVGQVHRMDVVNVLFEHAELDVAL